ncbi:hypothetical protein Tco_0776233 [Tanacetum coccineum]
MPMEFAIVKCRSPYNVIIGRTRMRSLEAVGSTIHSMIKFPTTQGIVTMETIREALWECRQLDRMQNTLKETQWRQQEEQMSRIREHARTQTKNSFGSRPALPKEESNNKETMIINLERSEQWATSAERKGVPLAKEWIIRMVQHPEWVANAIPIRLESGAWKVQVDYSSLNKVCAKDMYPFPEEGKGLASLMEYQYKCFL